ncbi:MAG: hypothetical protein EOP09_01725 [Proteobacteria bacterium]|nr:MAG: hypothetical protein EOP09_01725 [Pseudomonadota bacterium]
MKTIIISLAVLLCSCGDDDLPKYELLDRFRVLAIQANTPEVSPGATVTLTPYLSDPSGQGRAIQYSVDGCVDLGVNLGAPPTCEGNPSRVPLVATTSTAGPGTAPHYTGAVSAVTLTVPQAALIFANPASGGARSAVDQYNGVNYLVVFRYQAGDEVLQTFKRIIVSRRSVANANPVLTEIQFDGVSEAGASAPQTKTTLKSVVPAGSTETYSYQTTLGSLSQRSEELLVTWYASQGELLRTRTETEETNEYTPNATPGSSSTTFVAVLRDDRGGLAIRIVTK